MMFASDKNEYIESKKPHLFYPLVVLCEGTRLKDGKVIHRNRWIERNATWDDRFGKYKTHKLFARQYDKLALHKASKPLMELPYIVKINCGGKICTGECQAEHENFRWFKYHYQKSKPKVVNISAEEIVDAEAGYVAPTEKDDK